MTEAVVVNLFLWFRVFLVGGIFIALPRITRKGLLFGVFVGEAFSGGSNAKQILRSWDRGCGLTMAAALLIGLLFTLAGHPVAGNLTGTAVLLLGIAVLYLRTYARVKAEVGPDSRGGGERTTAALQVGKGRGETFAKGTLVVCILVALGTLVLALANYQEMAPRMPTLWRLIGGGGPPTKEKTLLTVLYVPSWNLLMGPVFAVLALMTATAKRSLREGPGGRSAEAQEAFRTAMAYVFSGTALFICAILTLISVQVVRIGLGETTALGGVVWSTMIAMILLALGSLVVIFRRYGQGGALREDAVAGGSLTGGLADNARWVMGLFYVNRDDPSMMVESRFLIGYDLNYGNPLALSFAVAAWALMILLAAVGVFLL